MADSIDSGHGTSDAFTDPFCDPCFEINGLKIGVSGFCRECVQFLCSDCRDVHGKLQSCKHHDVLQGVDIPKSQADKPPKFDFCDVHPKLLKDEFCCDHRSLTCTMCASSEHKGCCTKPVKEFCTTVDVSETGALYDKIKGLQETLKSTLTSVEKELKKMKDQEKALLHDVQQVYEQIIASVNKLFGSIKDEIQTSCQSEISLLSRQQKKVNDEILGLESLLSDVGELKEKPIDTKIFLKLQETVGYTTKFTVELKGLRKSLKFASLSFVPSKPVGDILSSSFTFGAVQKSESILPDADMLIPEILFPVSVLTQTAAQSKSGQTAGSQKLEGAVAKSLLSRPTQPLSKIKTTKWGTYNIKVKDDKYICYITGMAISKDRRLLIIDHDNQIVKVLSRNMSFLSSVSIPNSLWDIAVINDYEAVVTTDSQSLVILDISCTQLGIKTTAQLLYDVHGICRYKDKLIITSPGSKPRSVKLIDQTGRVYWSVSSDQLGQPLFSSPWYVSCCGGGRSSTVIVTDKDRRTLTMLNGETGEVITRRQLKERKYPYGVTTDSDGNVYVCYWWTDEVAVLSGDLSEEKILLSTQVGLSRSPQAIVCDDEDHRLIISYTGVLKVRCDDMDCFQLS